MTTDLFVNLLQLLGGIVIIGGYIPQIKKLLDTKDSRSFSITYLTLIVIGVILMEIYGLYYFIDKGQMISFLITNTFNLICAIVVLYLAILYKKN